MATSFSEAFRPTTTEFIAVSEPRELDQRSSFTARLPPDLAAVQYSLHDRRLLREHFSAPISTHARVHASGIYVTRIADQFQTEMDIGGAGLDRYWFGRADAGSVRVRQGGQSEVADGAAGVALRGHPGTSLLSTDGNIRTNLWIEADALESALSGMVDDELRQPLEFRSAIDWSTGLAASLSAQIDLFVAELNRPGGLASSSLALASFRDLITRTALLGLAHNYSECLLPRPGAPAPAYLHRAESFMQARADQMLRMEDVAAAAGCSVRTLTDVYRRFRETTPLAALHSIRLDHVRAALRREDDVSVVAIARRYGFTNQARFAASYRRRFGETPAKSTRRIVLREPVRDIASRRGVVAG